MQMKLEFYKKAKSRTRININFYKFKLLFFILVLVSVVVLLLPASILAQDSLSLRQITTIPILRDSTMISSITSIGDFNADGWGDLAIGQENVSWSRAYNALYIYYGGPTFDSIPDLCLIGDSQNTTICGASGDLATAFGEVVLPLNDFNGDSFDDFAVAAYAQCTYTNHNGRIYIYFGGPNPDTIPDIRIDGVRSYDGMGRKMAHGNFNGDNTDDLIAVSGDEYYSNRINIYLGSNPPDNSLD
jgi:hypothetical protein